MIGDGTSAWSRNALTVPLMLGVFSVLLGINYQSLQALKAMKRLRELESLSPPHN